MMTRYRAVCLAAVLCFLAPTAGVVLAQPDLRELLTKKLAYDDVVRGAEAQLAQGKGDKKELLVLQAYAHFLKAKLLVTGYASGAELAGLYYSCKESGVSKGEYFSFVQGINSAARGRLAEAGTQLANFRKSTKDKAAADIAAVWLGAIAEKGGKSADRDNAWKSIDWKNSANASERLAAYSVLALKNPPPYSRPPASNDPVQIRNSFLTPQALAEMNKADVVRLLGLLHPDKPTFSSKDKGGKKEVYYDILSILGAAKANAALGKIILTEVEQTLSPEERSGKKYSALRNVLGQCALMTDDLPAALKALENDPAPTSSVYLGAAYYRSGNTAKADEAWQAVEKGSDLRAQSELGYVFAMLGINLAKAEELAGKFLATSEDSQTPDQTSYLHLAFVKQQQGDLPRAKELLNQGYNFMRRGVLEAGANDPEYTVAFCAAIQRVDKTGMYDINDMLYKVREKYDFGVQLHEAATGLATCLEIKLGK